MTARGGCEPPGYDWAALVPRLIHPIRVGIIEALWRIDEPLSPTDVREIFDNRWHVSHLAYHLGMLARAGIVVKVDERKAPRGAIQKFYRLS